MKIEIQIILDVENRYAPLIKRFVKMLYDKLESFSIGVMVEMFRWKVNSSQWERLSDEIKIED